MPIYFPSLLAVIIAGPAGLLWAYSCLRFAGYLKQQHGYRTGYTRKVFHVLIFLSVVVLQGAWGFYAVSLFGVMVTLVLVYALWRGAGNKLFEAIAREQDAPHRSYYIVVPYCATLIGGLINNLLFGPLAIIGYLVGGLGDAAGEPVGTRWGKHRYGVPTFGVSAAATRSFEGSLGVLLVSLAALLLAIVVSPGLHLNARSLFVLPLIALVCTLAEAISPHGWDNTPMQILPTLLVAVLLTR